MARLETKKPHIRRVRISVGGPWVWGVFMSQHGRRPVTMSSDFSMLHLSKLFKGAKRGTHQA